MNHLLLRPHFFLRLFSSEVEATLPGRGTEGVLAPLLRLLLAERKLLRAFCHDGSDPVVFLVLDTEVPFQQLQRLNKENGHGENRMKCL